MSDKELPLIALQCDGTQQDDQRLETRALEHPKKADEIEYPYEDHQQAQCL